MKHTIKSPCEVHVIDLVIDPLAYYDALTASIYQVSHDQTSTEHLSSVLPTAIAQLNAIGDEHGALALAGLSAQLARHTAESQTDEASRTVAYVNGFYAVAKAY